MNERPATAVELGRAGLALGLASLLACGASRNENKRVSDEQPEAPWSLTYHDGSNNAFRFYLEPGAQTARFEYTPTQPETSSSGVYSGGSARSGELAPADADELWRRVEALEADASLRAEARKMGTGWFVLVAAGRERRFVIESSPELRALEGFLERFRAP